MLTISQSPTTFKCLTLGIATIVLTVIATAHADDATSSAARKIAQTIADSGSTRVAVLPFMFEADATTPSQGSSPRASSVSLDARLHVESFESFVIENANGRYSVLPSTKILETCIADNIDVSALSPTASSLQPILKKANDSLDAVIIGYLTKKTTQLDDGYYSAQDIAWRLLDLRGGDFIAAATQENVVSLAEAVYNGMSGEFFRWEKSKLKVLLEHDSSDRTSIPLSPREPEAKYMRFNGHLNPLFNIFCPYNVAFEVEGHNRSLMIPVSERKPFPITGEAPASAKRNDFDGMAFLKVERGEKLVVRVRNTTPHTARLAVFVDGVNTLGKRRQLPNDSCDAWVVKAGNPGVFRGFYSNWGPDGEVEEFEFGEWNDSVAGQLGLDSAAEASRTITIVVLTDGPVTRAQLALNPRFNQFVQEHWWDSDRGAFWVSESYVNFPMAAAPGVGFAGRPAIKQPLKLVNAKKPGILLAAMTVHYGTQSDLERITRRMQHEAGDYFTEFVSATTNWTK